MAMDENRRIGWPEWVGAGIGNKADPAPSHMA